MRLNGYGATKNDDLIVSLLRLRTHDELSRTHDEEHTHELMSRTHEEKWANPRSNI